MADKNIQIKQKNGAGWDNLYPKSKASIIVMDDGTTPLSSKIASMDTAISQKTTMTDVNNAIASVINSAPDQLNTLDELAQALGDDANFANTVTASLASKAPLTSPTFTGTVGGITKTMVGLGNVDNTADANKPISTAQQNALNAKAPLANPALTGVPTAPTAVAGTNTTQIATTAFVKNACESVNLNVPAISATEPASGNLWFQEI